MQILILRKKYIIKNGFLQEVVDFTSRTELGEPIQFINNSDETFEDINQLSLQNKEQIVSERFIQIPDLRNKFILGRSEENSRHVGDNYKAGKFLTAGKLPKHNHVAPYRTYESSFSTGGGAGFIFPADAGQGTLQINAAKGTVAITHRSQDIHLPGYDVNKLKEKIPHHLLILYLYLNYKL